jgi:hypothetical protein
MKNKKNLYKTINYLNELEFGINTTLLNYLLNEGNYLLNDDKLNNKSDLLQKEMTLKIARTYSNKPFYLPVHAD